MGNFQYDPLTGADIRIVRLHGSHTLSAPINCALVHRPLRGPETARYEALSYVWGDVAAHKSSISLNGAEFTVSDNLFAALRRLRLPDSDRDLWVDALCINQADNAEKSREVLRMLDIYRAAERVLVWLGEEADTTGLAMAQLAQLGNRWQGIAGPSLLAKAYRRLGFTGSLGRSLASKLFAVLFFECLSETVSLAFFTYILWHWPFGNGLAAWVLFLLPLYFAYTPALLLLITLVLEWYGAWTAQLTAWDADAPSDGVLAALTELFGRPWFTRIWVVQEAAAAREAVVVCGTHVVPWQTLRDACRQLARVVGGWRKSRYADTGFQRAYHVAESLDPADPTLYHGDGVPSRSLFALLCHFHISDATVLHDKVYALLGLAVEIQQPAERARPFVPDYDLPLSVVYTQTARLLIEVSDSLQLLRACRGKTRVEHLPSWVPDWTLPSRRLTEGGSAVLRLPHEDREEGENSTGKTKNNASWIVQYSDDGLTITVRGFLVGTLTGEPIVPEKAETDFERLMVGALLTVQVWWLKVLRLPLTWWLIGRLVRAAAPPGQLAEWTELFEIHRDLYTGGPPPTSKSDLPLDMFEAQPEVLRTDDQLRVFTIDYADGVPRMSQFQCASWSGAGRPGDSMWLIHGADRPVVLRRQGDRWTVLGPAIYGAEHRLWKWYLERYKEGRVSLHRLEIA